MDAKLKALKARNEYILSMDSANAAIHKYFVEDLSDIVDVSSDDKLSPLLFSASNNIWEIMREKGNKYAWTKYLSYIKPLMIEPHW